MRFLLMVSNLRTLSSHPLSHPAEPGPDQGKNAVTNKAGPDRQEEIRAIGVLAQGLEAAVQSGGLLRRVLGCRDDKQEPRKDQRNALRHMPRDAEGIDDPAAAGAVEVEELLLEPAPDAFQDEVNSDAHDGEPDCAQYDCAERCGQQRS